MGWLKKIAHGVRDAAKAVSYIVVAPINSVTRHEYKPKYNTPFGERFGAVLENSVDNAHAMGKAFADTLFRGLPSKIVNKIFPKSKPESLGNYMESGKDYGNKWLNKLNQFSTSLGSVFASTVGGGGANGEPEAKPEPEILPEVPVAVKFAIVVLVLLVLINRIFK